MVGVLLDVQAVACKKQKNEVICFRFRFRFLSVVMADYFNDVCPLCLLNNCCYLSLENVTMECL